jgi:hypothetical protein
MREQQINELQGTSILTKSFFNKLIRRIECTKPLAGEGITISEKENGFEVSFGVAGGGGFREVTLNVCSNGTPDTITVLAKA